MTVPEWVLNQYMDTLAQNYPSAKTSASTNGGMDISNPGNPAQQSSQLGVGVPVPGPGSGYVLDPNTGQMRPPVPMSAQQIALMMATGIPSGYGQQAMQQAPVQGSPTVPTPMGAPQTSAQMSAMLGAQTQANMGGVMTPSGAANPLSMIGYMGSPNPTVGANTIQNIVDQAGTDYGSILGMPQTPQVNPFQSSGLGVNEAALAQFIWENPQLAIGLGNVAEPGTPGYNNLANMGFDPYNIYLASGGDMRANATDYTQWLANMYQTLGTVSNQGGGSISAGPLLANLVAMPASSDLGQMFSEDPTVFYQMASSVMDAAGASPMAVSGFKQQMAQLMLEYMEYTSTTNASDNNLPINQWIAKNHPEIVQAWTGGQS